MNKLSNLDNDNELLKTSLIQHYKNAKKRQQKWEPLWQDCYNYSLPNYSNGGNPGLFDSTAGDAIEQLGSSLMAYLTPPWSNWFEFTCNNDDLALSQELEKITSLLHNYFNRSNFMVEIQQCYIDLIINGTACLLFEETNDSNNIFRFCAIPINNIALGEGNTGLLDKTFRKSFLTIDELKTRFPDFIPPKTLLKHKNKLAKLGLIEAVLPSENDGYDYIAAIVDSEGSDGLAIDCFIDNNISDDTVFVVSTGYYQQNPFINFRWMKSSGEIYGRSPMMKVLPDVKTVNKMMELTLKNASIAVTGIWQADDDGVLNPTNIKLTPGTIIPKAVGSSGLTPLKPAGEFKLSEVMINNLQKKIRHGLFADQLGVVNNSNMTATEIMQRAGDNSRILGAIYGRLKTELLFPLLKRALNILIKKGEIKPINIESNNINIRILSAIGEQSRREEAMNLVNFLQTMNSFSPESLRLIDEKKAINWLVEKLNIPNEIIKTTENYDNLEEANNE